MIFYIQQYVKKKAPIIKGSLFRILFSSKRFKIGRSFQCDTFPSFIINKNCKIEIGDNVQFRRNVELRSHGTSVINIESNTRIDRGVRILATNQSEIIIKKGARVGLYTVFNGGDSIYIGEKALVSGYVYLQTSMHNHKKGKDVQDQGYSHAPVRLEKDAWLGAHVVVLPNCIIGEGAVVGSNAVVTKSIKAFDIVGGVPAKEINERL